MDHMTLTDLLSKKYLKLRTHIETIWNEQHDFPISTTTWAIIAFVYQGKTTIAEVTRQANLANVSRQAIHKIIKNLEARGLVFISDSKENKKVKRIELTTEGIDCYKRLNAIKVETEHKIKTTIGEEAFNTLINLLKINWELN